MGATIGTVEQLRAALRAATEAAQAVMTKAEAENRELTQEERDSVDEKLAEARGLKGKVDRATANDAAQAEIAALLAVSRVPAAPTPAATVKTLGTQWVESPAFEFFRQGRHRGLASWASEAVELVAATLTEDPASGGKLLTAQQVPGILSIPSPPLLVADLFAQGTATTAAISYLIEKTAVNAAAAVAEGGVKPESTLTFDAVTEAVRKVATWLPVSEEMLADVDQIRSYIDARLSLFVNIRMDEQVLNGNGVAPNMRGLLQTPGLSGPVAAGADETNADALFRGLMTVLLASYLMPDAIVMNPADWAGSVTAKTPNGEYYGPGMFAALPAPALWGVRVVPTPAIPQGTGVPGAYKAGGQYWTRSGLVVQASNSHADFFVKNLVAIRAEKRGLLTVYRPAAFCQVTGLKSGLTAPVAGLAGTPELGTPAGFAPSTSTQAGTTEPAPPAPSARRR